ncbi:MAG: hypothetical protein ACLTOX_06305 [Streptococcus thermophilus]
MGYSIVSLYFLCGFAGSALQLAFTLCLWFWCRCLTPSVNSLLTKMTPKKEFQESLALIKVFHTWTSFRSFCGFSCCNRISYRWVFFVTAIIVFGNFVCSLIIFENR